VIDGTRYYFTRDHLGSVREMADSSGTIRARYSYDPWGRRTKTSGDLDADFGFTGHYYHPPSGLDLTLYRIYDADLGRWLSRDPIGDIDSASMLASVYLHPTRVRGRINDYWYASNNPIDEIDPNGDCAQVVIVIVVVVLIIAIVVVEMPGKQPWQEESGLPPDDTTIPKNPKPPASAPISGAASPGGKPTDDPEILMEFEFTSCEM